MKISYMEGVPGPLNVRCPRCDARAEYDLPFDLFVAARGAPADEQRTLHRWGGWLLAEKYPAVRPWDAAIDSISESDGVVKCSRCHFLARHTLKWPQDAFYRWEIRGNTLWAFNVEHARVLREFLAGKDRDITRHPEYARNLMKIPGEFLSAKLRDRIEAAIDGTLERE